MGELSRRGFLAAVTASAAAWGLDPQVVGDALAAPLVPADVNSTLLQTVLQGSVRSSQYRSLTTGPGEPFVPRLDVLRKPAATGRAATRRSLLYLGHLSDMHVMDSQSPMRLEPMIAPSPQDHDSFAGVFHPHEALTVHVTAAMVKSFSDLRISPLSGAPMGVALVTGDSADMHNHQELRWYIDVLDGGRLTPSSSPGGAYVGVQAWPEAVWAYRPGDPSGGDFGDYGFPRLPNLLSQAVAGPVESVGLPVPWYAVYGNHDTLLFGTFDISSQMRALAVGSRKSDSYDATVTTMAEGYASTASPAQRLIDAFGLQLGRRPGMRAVPANAERRIFEQRDFMVEHFVTTDRPGPVGHGFTQRNLDTGETWWKSDLTPQIRALGLDTCNQVAGPDGAVPDDQFRWLTGELATAQSEQKLVLLVSHHNSFTLENRAQRPGETQVLHGADDLVNLLLSYPAVIGWLNGHTHLNQILGHAGPSGGFWEITTASCIEFPQQQQVVEIMDNRDGTLSIFTTVVDHASPVTPGASGSYLDLAAQSRELAVNDWAARPLMRRGSPLDRNTELLLPAPFDLSTITDATLETQRAAQRARLLEYESRQPR